MIVIESCVQHMALVYVELGSRVTEHTHSCLSLNIRSKAGGWRHFLTWDCGQCPRHSGDHCLSSVCPKRTDRDSVVWECQGQRVWPLGDTSWNGPLHIPRWTVIDKNSGTEQSHWNGRPHAVEKNTTVEIIAPPRPRPLKRSIYGAAAQTDDDTSNCWSSNWGLSFTYLLTYGHTLVKWEGLLPYSSKITG